MLLVEAHPLFIDSQLLSLERGNPLASRPLLLMLSRGSKPAVAFALCFEAETDVSLLLNGEIDSLDGELGGPELKELNWARCDW